MNTYSYIEFHQLLGDAWNVSQELPVTFNEFEYLYAIHKAERSTIDEITHNNLTHLSSLASTMSIKKSSASIMLNKLEKKGLIKRIDCRYDSRAQHILLSDQGREIFLSSLEVINLNINQRIGTTLTKPEISTLHSLIEKIVLTKEVNEK